MQQNDTQKQMCFTPIFLSTMVGRGVGERKGQSRVEAPAPNPLGFGESKQECCLTTAEDLELLPAMTATAAGWGEPDSSWGPAAASCSSTAPRLLQTNLSLSLDANVDERQGIVQTVLFQVYGIKKLNSRTSLVL